MDALYQEEILEHWRRSPYRGTLEAPDRAEEGMNPLCGDQMRIELRISDDRLLAMRFQGQGCVISQAAASILAATVEGRSLAEVRAMPSQELLAALGVPLSPARLKCALLPWAVLRQALGVSPHAADGSEH
ncbi:MAG TPA: iron-sulfur cluster assembly scaffold protein [Chloroflexota bacterium]